MAKSSSTKIKETFSFKAPEALSVMLVGDFTHWQKEPISMKKGKNGIWSASVKLDPGTYHYRFMVNGEWRDDPECTIKVPNPFGSENNIRKVG